MIDFNSQFKKACEILEESDRNLFITGKAGTGKSTFLKYFCENTKKKYVLLAPTGVAAVNIGGQTIHSFFRFKPGVTIEEAKNQGKKLQKNKLIKNLGLIIIDEISMVRCDLLDCVDICLKTAKKNKKVFGGVQMLFIGDLYQLPPVVTSKEKEIISAVYKTPYFFSAKAMDIFETEFIEFEKIYRQKDENFINLLNHIRNKTADEQLIDNLNERLHIDSTDNIDDFIYLTARNQQAQEINLNNLEKLSSKKYHYSALVEGDFSSDSYPAQLELTLRNGARVMFLNNDSKDRWINGTLGWIVKTTKDNVVVKLDSGETVEVQPYAWSIYRSRYDEKQKTIKREILGSFSQIPLQLAWAITIHKSQGKTFNKAIVDIGKGTFTHGQVYVALSRCRSFDGLILKQRIELKHIWMDRRVVGFLTKFQYKLSEKKLSKRDKMILIEKAIRDKKKLEIIYLKSKDEKSKRVILPLSLAESEYKGYPYVALEAYCFLRCENRVFNVGKILEISDGC